MTPQTLTFLTPGHLDVEAALTMGVHAKLGDHPIGQFGTGLKYALAVLLRTDHRVQITFGGEGAPPAVTFSTEARTTRGTTYHLVRASVGGGVPRSLGFTTDLGKHWKVWMAYRELWSNTQDEGGSVGTPPGALPGPWTAITVRGAPLAEAHGEQHKFLLSPITKLHSDSWVEVHSGRGIFYRGILVADVPTAFAYNLTTDITLTEDRTLESPSLAAVYIRDCILSCPNAELVARALQGDWEERNFSYLYVSTSPSEEFLEAARRVGGDSAQGFIHRHRPRELEELPPAAAEREALACAQRTLRRLGLEVALPKVARLDPNLMGLARGGEAFIARSTFSMGQRQVTSTVLEEYLHAHMGLEDLSRRMQSWLMDSLVGVLEQGTQEAGDE